MRRLFFLCLLLMASCGWARHPRPNGVSCRDKKFDREVAHWLKFAVPTIDVDSLRKIQNNVTILDAREAVEFSTSHIEGAIFGGYDNFDEKSIKNLDKNKPIVVYCSIGYRSEQIAIRLQKMGFTNVMNLYGSLFEWVNRGYPIVDKTGKSTQNIHTFNKNWSKWVSNSKFKKIF